MTSSWRDALEGDPLPWLLETEDPAVRHLTLRLLLDEPEDSTRVRRAQAAAMRAHPIASILHEMRPEGWWVKPGAGYSPKYTGTVWSLIFLDQLGADGRDHRIQAACGYVLEHTTAANGGFGAYGGENRRPANASVVHCLNGNLLRAMIGFGHLDDPRTRRAIEWEARAITGEGFDGYLRSGTSGPDFACAINGRLPCAWGANKALHALARVPPRRRTALVRRAISRGAAFLLSVDPATAAYPTDTSVSGSWFKLGFPLGYIGDVLETLDVLAQLGHGRDPRIANAIDWVLGQQDGEGRWRNRHACSGKTWGDIERQGAPSRWVTFRACLMLKRAMS